jgi:16S rRNA (cytosine967-C5)-methyltransferase
MMRRKPTARAAAATAIERAVAGRQYVRETLAEWAASTPLEPRDAALAAEIALGAVRHWITLEAVLGRVATLHRERTPPTLRAILAAGAFQLIWLDRIPDHAAVGETVVVARAALGAKAAGMVNAVLRNLARAIADRRTAWVPDSPRHVRTGWETACAFQQDILPPIGRRHDRLAHIAAAAGERPDRLAFLAKHHGRREAEQIAWASQAQPPTVLQRNSLRISAADFTARVRAEFGDSAELPAPNALSTSAATQLDCAFLPPSAPLGASPLLREGLAYVQDPTARAAADLLAAHPGESILDLCAAPGGKSIALALALRDQGRIVACDVSSQRLARVSENAVRLQLRSIEPHLLPAAPPTAPQAQPSACAAPLAAAFDAALVDVPCSNSGVLARRPEARFRLTPAHCAALRAVQLALLQQAASVVRPAGRLVYSTCSIDPGENQDLVAAFLQTHTAWRLAASRVTLPHWGPRFSDWRDGGYAALLIRI